MKLLQIIHRCPAGTRPIAVAAAEAPAFTAALPNDKIPVAPFVLIAVHLSGLVYVVNAARQLFFAEVEAMLAEGREVQIRMKGHSMRPLLRSERDQVVLTPCADPARLQPGDVVLFRCCGRHILHRIVRRDGERLTLAGDGNYRITEQCTTRDVAGIAVRVIRASGRVVGCDSPGWRLRSRLWLAIPPWLRRQVLRVLWHSGWK